MPLPFAIERQPGMAPGRSSGVAYGPFAWAVATADGQSGDMAEQTELALAKIDRVLASMGASKASLLSATVYIADMALKADLDRVWLSWIGPDPAAWPQRACVQAGLAGDALVEIVVVAGRSQD